MWPLFTTSSAQCFQSFRVYSKLDSDESTATEVHVAEISGCFQDCKLGPLDLAQISTVGGVELEPAGGHDDPSVTGYISTYFLHIK